MANRWGKCENSVRFPFLGFQNQYDIRPLLTKVRIVKTMVFPVVMYGCESWTIKKAEHWTIDVFEPWCWRLESPLDCKEIQPVHPKGNQSWIFIERTDAKVEIPIAVATWCEELTHLKGPWCWERLKAGGEGDDRGWDGWMASLTQDMSLSKLRELVMDRAVRVLQSTGSQRVGPNWATELNWTASFVPVL